MKNVIKIKNNEHGFTLLEIILVVVVLGILSAVVVPKLGGMISGSEENATRSEMGTLKSAIVGDASARVGGIVIDQGYKGDLGYRPASLADLVTKPGGDPVYNPFVQMGWNGPYMSDDGNASYMDDAWDNPYTLSDTSIVSNGPDGILGTGDDISISF